jgi:HPt (histidine-containing phosphotransfer) domain-containing protein
MAALIDWGKVRELRDEVGDEDFDEVVELFLEEVEETLGQLGGIGRCVEHDLHFLKGSALNLGFAHFSGLCQQGETAAADGRAGEVDLVAVREAYVSSKQAFTAEYDISRAG